VIGTVTLVLVYLLALAVAGIVGVAVYFGLSPLHRFGAVGRWIARCAAGALAMIGFIGIVLATGQGASLSRTGDVPSWKDGMIIAVVLGIAYATLWPIGKHWRWPAYLLAVNLSLLALACGDGTDPNEDSDIARVVVGLEDPASGTGGLVVNESLQLVTFLLDSTDQILPSRPAEWTSSDPALATVTDVGLVTGVAPGSVTITAAVGSKAGTYDVDIVPLAASLEFLPDRLGLVPGGVYDLVVIFRDGSGAQLGPEGRRITWEIDAPSVASLEGGINAIVTGLVPGTATLTATGSGASAATEADVTAVAFVYIFAGGRHSCAVTVNDVTYCWGSNVLNLLASPVGMHSAAPLRTEGAGPSSSVVSADAHACLLTVLGESWCWGNGSVGQLGDGSSDPSANGSHTPRKTLGGHQFIQLTLGEGYSCGLTVSADAYCWGSGTEGQLGNGRHDLITTTPTAVAGSREFTQLTSHAVGRSTCGLTAAGEAWCWGRNTHGQLGDGSTAERAVPTPVAGGLGFTTISAGVRHTCGLVAGGDAYCWGDNELGQLGQAGTHETPGLVAGGLAFAQISAGTAYTCGITPTGEAYCWGDNERGQLGNGTTEPAAAPVAVTGGLRFSQLSAGHDHTCGLTDSGVAYCWGSGEAVGSLVDGFVAVPTEVQGQADTD
jgi:alpha-tubulin suppressor-like RCC1 family protein